MRDSCKDGNVGVWSKGRLTGSMFGTYHQQRQSVSGEQVATIYPTSLFSHRALLDLLMHFTLHKVSTHARRWITFPHFVAGPPPI